MRMSVIVATLSLLLTSFATSESIAQFGIDTREGLTTKISQPVVATPKWLRILLPMKAEEATDEKAIGRLAGHIETVGAALRELGALPSSIHFSAVESHSSTEMRSLSSMSGNNQAAWQVQQAFLGDRDDLFAIQAEPAQGFAGQPMITVQSTANGIQGEAAKSLPKFVVATSIAAADWNIEGKSPSEIAILKSNITNEIVKRKLDGSELFHKFTAEEEDEIFEITKIDIRNGDSRAVISSPVAASKVLYLGSIPEKDYNDALKQAFHLAEKRSKQLAIAGNLKLGKIEYVDIQVEQRVGSSGVVPSYRSYSGDDSVRQIEWEPALQADEFRSENIHQLNKNLILTVRFKLE